MHRTSLLKVLSVALVASAHASYADVVPYVNPSFETPSLGTGTQAGVSAWGGSNSVTAVGSSVGITPTDGAQIAYNDSAAGANFIMFQQTLESVAAGEVYNLQVDVYPLVDDATNSCLGIELSPSSFGLNFDTRYWRSNNFAVQFPFGPFAGPDTITPVVGQWNRVFLGFSADDFPTKIGDQIQLTIRGHKFAIDNVILTKGPQTFYISSSTGSDLNDGFTESTPLASFDNLNGRTLAPGSAVYLKRGDTWTNSQLVLGGKGTVGNPVRLSAYGEGPNPIITGINVTTEPAVIINNPSHWEIDSLDLRDAKVGLYLRYTGGNTDGTGAMFNNQNVTISHCNFQGMNYEWSDVNGDVVVNSPFELSWGAGIWVGGNLPSPPGGPHVSETTNVLDGLTVRHSSFQQTSTGVGNGWYFPPKFFGRMTNVTLEDLWVTGCENGSVALFDTEGVVMRRVDTWLGGTGFYANGTTGGFVETVRDILVEDCEFAFNKRNSTGNDGVGFDFEGDTQDAIFQHNVIHNNDGAGMLILPNPENNLNIQMLSNTFWNNARNPKDSGQNKELTASNNSHSGAFTNNGVYIGTDQIPSTLAVYNNVTRWNTLFSANTGGNRTATPWSAVSGRPTAWTFDSTVEGWGNQNDWGGLAASGGSLVGTSTGVDPFVESADTWVNTRERRWVLVTMSQTVGTAAQIFFQLETDPTWTPQKSVSFPIIADGTMRTYAVDMGQSTEYRGVVTKWRLDPTEANGSTMAIDEFSARLDPYLSSITAISHDTIDITFNQAMLPQSGLFDPANYTISGLGQGTLANNPDTVTQLPTPSGPVYRLKWDTGASNGLDATVTVVNVQAARGHTIGPVNSLGVATISGPSSVGEWFLID